MDSIQPQLDDLTSKISSLESALAPLFAAPLNTTTSKLPLLDKAKLYILSTYALESILFCFIRLNGIDAKSHPVYQELNRLKEYFRKIKSAEETGAGRRSTSAAKLDKGAATRFIKAALAGNDKNDREREDGKERERTSAKRKLEAMSGVGTHTRFTGLAKRMTAAEEETVDVVKASEVESDDEKEAQEVQELEDEGMTPELQHGVEHGAQKRQRRKKEKRPLDGKEWMKAVGEMQAEDPESVIPGVKKYEASDDGNLSRNKKKKQKK